MSARVFLEWGEIKEQVERIARASWKFQLRVTTLIPSLARASSLSMLLSHENGRRAVTGAWINKKRKKRSVGLSSPKLTWSINHHADGFAIHRRVDKQISPPIFRFLYCTVCTKIIFRNWWILNRFINLIF